MSGSSEGSSNSLQSTIDPVVRELLQGHESEDSLTRGTIVDLATISHSSPYENFEVEIDRIINPSKRLIERIADTNRHQDCIALAVEHPSKGIFVDLFTYESSGNTEHDSIESLAMELGVDVSSVHHLIGKDVDIVKVDGSWVICEHKDRPPIEPSVTKRDFLQPLSIGALPLPLGFLFGWQTEYSILITTIAGLFGAIIAFALLLYLTLAAKRDHPMPGFIGRIFTPDYTEGAGIIEDGDPIADVEQGEFERLITLADEDEHDSPRAVLHNLAVVVTVPPSGEKVIPIPSPTTCWRETTIKSLVYTLSSSVETLDRSQGQLVPLCREGNRIRVDRTRLKVPEPPMDRTFAEKVADGYVSRINSVFDTPLRNDIYR